MGLEFPGPGITKQPNVRTQVIGGISGKGLFPAWPEVRWALPCRTGFREPRAKGTVRLAALLLSVVFLKEKTSCCCFFIVVGSVQKAPFPMDNFDWISM